jgi:ABC-2 type transport system ATP-binding protein
MITFKNVTKIFKTELFTKPFQALDELSFSVEEGKVTGFLGANGAGKTTSLKILMDFVRKTSGEITFSKSLGGSNTEIFKNIGFLPERAYFYPHLTGEEFCYYMGGLQNLSSKEIKLQVQNWAPKFKIDFALDRKIRTYSKGMLQRIGFLVTLLHDPKIIILDEPLSGLDPIGRKELKDIILEVKALGKTVFFSSHIVSDVEEVCDRVIFIKDGKLVYEGDVQDILSKSEGSLSEIKYFEANEMKSKEVKSTALNTEIEELIKSNNQIVSVNSKRLTLEEIFYKV